MHFICTWRAKSEYVETNTGSERTMKGDSVMHVLMIGTLVPDEIERFCYMNGCRVSAADIAQRYILHGLQKQKEVDSVDVIGAIRVKPWPKIKVLRFPSGKELIKKGSIESCGYLNFSTIGFWLREVSLCQKAKNWACAHKQNTNVVIFVYAMSSSGLKAAYTVKKVIPHAKLILCVPDLPLLMKPGNHLRAFAKQVDWMRINWFARQVDGYLLYTKYMSEYLCLGSDKWMLFEGLIDEERIIEKNQEKYDMRVCLYAGNLDARYGIDMLIEAFRYVNKGAMLLIYGKGTEEEQEHLNKLISGVDNVAYKGHVTQDEIYEIMKRSTLLLNPRPTSLALTKYSCPSKTFEYMASGTPLVMNRLSGLPDEYSTYVTFFAGESPEQYAETINDMLSKSEVELKQIGMRAAQFLRENKNSSQVMERVLRFAETLR